MVHADVYGSALTAALQAAGKAPRKVCASGLGDGCGGNLASVSQDRLRVNGRPIDPRLVYRIVLPDYLAESLKLEHDDDAPVLDLIGAFDSHLRAGRWRAGATGDKLGSQFEAGYARGWQGYLALPALDFGYTRVKPEDPEGSTSVRRNLPVDFSGAKEYRTWSVTLDGDLALVDAVRYAIRVPGSVKYTRRAESDEISYDADEFSVGARADLKLGRLTPFAGYFIDGQTVTHKNRVAAARVLDGGREGFKLSETAQFQTVIDLPARRYRHWAVGVDVLRPVKKDPVPWFSSELTRLGLRWTAGTESGIPERVTIDGEEQDFDTFFASGAKALLDRFFKDHPESFSSATDFVIHPEPMDQARWQADAEGQLTFKVKGRNLTTQVKARMRWWDPRGEARSPFLLSSDNRFEVKAAVPFLWRMNLSPAYVFHIATIDAEDNDVFRYHRLDVKLSLPLTFRFGGTGVVLR